MSDGITCSNCGGTGSSVKDSRFTKTPVCHIRRRRECNRCGLRFTTREITDDHLRGFIRPEGRIGSRIYRTSNLGGSRHE